MKTDLEYLEEYKQALPRDKFRLELDYLLSEVENLRAEREVLRDKFAMAVMNALVSRSGLSTTWAEKAESSYEAADAMLEARKNTR